MKNTLLHCYIVTLLRRQSKKSQQLSNVVMKQSSQGFTLIELLIVIVIIGILTSLLTANFIAARQRARDARRKSDLRQIQSALELYRADVGTYPLTGSITCGNTLTPPTGTTVYMQSIPCDPTTNSDYTYTSDGTTYSIFACLENFSDQDVDRNNSCPPESNTVSFTVQNP